MKNLVLKNSLSSVVTLVVVCLIDNAIIKDETVMFLTNRYLYFIKGASLLYQTFKEQESIGTIRFSFTENEQSIYKKINNNINRVETLRLGTGHLKAKVNTEKPWSTVEDRDCCELLEVKDHYHVFLLSQDRERNNLLLSYELVYFIVKVE